MKNQALFSSKDISKKLKCRQLQFLFGALRVNYNLHSQSYIYNYLKFVYLYLYMSLLCVITNFGILFIETILLAVFHIFR